MQDSLFRQSLHFFLHIYVRASVKQMCICAGKKVKSRMMDDAVSTFAVEQTATQTASTNVKAFKTLMMRRQQLW